MPGQQGRLVEFAGDRQGLLGPLQGVGAQKQHRGRPCRRARGRAPRPPPRGAARRDRRGRHRTRPALPGCGPALAKAAAATTPAPTPARYRSFPGSTRTRPAGCRSRRWPPRDAARNCCLPARQARQPAPCSSRGDAPVLRRPRRIPRAFRPRTGAPSPATDNARSAPAFVGHQQRLVDQKAELIEYLIVLHRAGAGDRLVSVAVFVTTSDDHALTAPTSANTRHTDLRLESSFRSFTARRGRRFCGHGPSAYGRPFPGAWRPGADEQPGGQRKTMSPSHFDSDRPTGALDSGSRVARVVSAELAAG